MKYKALVSFVGAISMAKGEIRELPDSPNVRSLINAKYLEVVSEHKRTTKKK